jgi:hypothetical protein
VLRLSGFSNRKLTEEFVVRAHHQTDAVHTLCDFTIEADSPEAVRHSGDAHQSRTNTSGHKSQSERDWAYANRALERGDNPEEIIRTIADYRSQDKADPNYDARRTVTKAQARPLSPSNILSDSLHPILEKLGQLKAGAHAFRRFRATWLRMQRTPEDLIRFWLGHANKTITDGYSLLKEDSQFRRKIAEQVNIGFEIPAPELDVAPKQRRYQRCRSTMKLKRKNSSPSRTICEP